MVAHIKAAFGELVRVGSHRLKEKRNLVLVVFEVGRKTRILCHEDRNVLEGLVRLQREQLVAEDH